jgi:hypothetical protein
MYEAMLELRSQFHTKIDLFLGKSFLYLLNERLHGAP